MSGGGKGHSHRDGRLLHLGCDFKRLKHDHHHCRVTAVLEEALSCIRKEMAPSRGDGAQLNCVRTDNT